MDLNAHRADHGVLRRCTQREEKSTNNTYTTTSQRCGYSPRDPTGLGVIRHVIGHTITETSVDPLKEI